MAWPIGSRVVVVDPERAGRLAEHWPYLDEVASVVAVRAAAGEEIRGSVAGAGVGRRCWRG